MTILILAIVLACTYAAIHTWLYNQSATSPDTDISGLGDFPFIDLGYITEFKIPRLATGGIRHNLFSLYGDNTKWDWQNMPEKLYIKRGRDYIPVWYQPVGSNHHAWMDEQGVPHNFHKQDILAMSR